VKNILLINGPNLNMLGTRETDKYGSVSLSDIIDNMNKLAENMDASLRSFQSNSEGEIVDFIHQNGINCDGIIINAGAYTHTSVAIRDAILCVNKPFVEVHISNIYKREEFRQFSYLSDIAVGIIAGFGENSYYLGLRALVDFLEKIS
jgi:3-dehydroquinate dehydratase-2